MRAGLALAWVASACGARLPEPQETWACGPSRCDVELRVDPERFEVCATLGLGWDCDDATCWTGLVGGDDRTVCAATQEEAEAWCAQVQPSAVVRLAVDDGVAAMLERCPDVLVGVRVVECDPVEPLRLARPCIPADGP